MLAQTPSVGELLTGWQLVTSFAGVMVIAFLTGRLLGARRSWSAAAISGLVGWVTGAILAVALAKDHENGSAGFTRNLWLFSAFFTMSATVWMEMLAKPGALARAQTSLASIPRPLRAVRRRTQRVTRYAQITRIIARHGLGRQLGIADAEAADGSAGDGAAPAAVRLRRALEDCGGMFVKLGQILSTRADLLPAPVVEELSRLQDHVQPVAREDIAALLERELGAPVETIFSEFEWTPLAAASIGQAHEARLPTGEPVVVKVQRPDIAERVERDLDVVAQFGRTLEARAAWAQEYHVMDLVQEFSERLREELDFRIEARNATEIGERLAAYTDIRVPRVHRELTTARVLVMEWLDGESVRQLVHTPAGPNQARLADSLLRCALQQMLVDGHFHADPHPGNVLLLRTGQLGLIDFGAAGRLDPIQLAALREVMLAVSQQDPRLLRQAILEVSSVRRGFDDELFERALARFMARHLGAGAVPSAAMFNELLQLLFTFGVALPPEFSTFFRALITLEGTLTTISPGFGVIDAAQEIAREWASERALPATFEDFARQELLGLVPVLRRLPNRLDRLTTMAQRGDLTARLSLFSIDDDVRVVTTLVNRVVLAFLGGIVGVMSVMLIGIDDGPEFSGSTSLYEFFGYFGLFCSTVLVMRVLVAILRDGAN
jgi:ubiquinone biosynthesis protein